MKREYVYLLEMGYVFRLTRAKYHRFLTARTNNDYETAETMLGDNLGKAINVTDMGPEEAREMAADIPKVPVPRRRPKPD